MEQPPTLADLQTQIIRLQHQATTVLYLSGVNLFLNCAMLAISFLLSLS